MPDKGQRYRTDNSPSTQPTNVESNGYKGDTDHKGGK